MHQACLPGVHAASAMGAAYACMGAVAAPACAAPLRQPGSIQQPARRRRTWVGRQLVLGQASQLGVPLLGLTHTDSTKISKVPKAGGVIAIVAVVWSTELGTTATDQLWGQGGVGRGGADVSVCRRGAAKGKGRQGEPAACIECMLTC